MANTPTSFRLPFVLSSEVHPDVQQAIRYAFSGLKDLNDAVGQLATKANTASTVINTTNVAGGGGGSSPVAGSIGVVNEQSTGAYTLLAGDFGAIVVLDTAPTFALTLSSLTTPFYAIISNQCAGVATLTPDSATSTVNGFASWPVPPGGFAIVAFDGTLWWAVPVCPANTPAIPHQWINSYQSSTGVFGQSQPRASDLIDSTVGAGPVVLDSGCSLYSPTIYSTMSIKNLQAFANNGAAVAGGLVAGNIYRLGGDPDLLAVVH